jgi:hypothetical protein
MSTCCAEEGWLEKDSTVQVLRAFYFSFAAENWCLLYYVPFTAQCSMQLAEWCQWDTWKEALVV